MVLVLRLLRRRSTFALFSSTATAEEDPPPPPPPPPLVTLTSYTTLSSLLFLSPPPPLLSKSKTLHLMKCTRNVCGHPVQDGQTRCPLCCVFRQMAEAQIPVSSSSTFFYALLLSEKKKKMKKESFFVSSSISETSWRRLDPFQYGSIKISSFFFQRWTKSGLSVKDGFSVYANCIDFFLVGGELVIMLKMVSEEDEEEDNFHLPVFLCPHYGVGSSSPGIGRKKSRADAAAATVSRLPSNFLPKRRGFYDSLPPEKLTSFASSDRLKKKKDPFLFFPMSAS